MVVKITAEHNHVHCIYSGVEVIIGPQLTNKHGQPIGRTLKDWKTRPRPSSSSFFGRWCDVQRLNPDRHGPSLFQAISQPDAAGLWTYLHYGPFAEIEEFTSWLWTMAASEDPLCFAIVDRVTGHALGIAAYLNVLPDEGRFEIGHIFFTPGLQRTTAATEALFLMLDRAFGEWGYRRCEWKCDDLNAASKAAAVRRGFRLDGVFLQSCIYKGRNRDTAWFSILDNDWERLRPAYTSWLDPSNFDADGRQKSSLRPATLHPSQT